MVDQMRFQNQDLVLRVSNTAKTSVFDINDYEPFIEALCGTATIKRCHPRRPTLFPGAATRT
jgi:hypothetical protein